MKRTIFLFCFCLLSLLPAQSLNELITDEKASLMILAANEGNNLESIESKVTQVVADQAVKLGRFNIIDRTALQRILGEQALQMSGVVSDSDIVAFGEISATKEALLVEVMSYGQKGVKPEEDKEQDREDRKTARKAGILGVIVKTLVDAAVETSKEDKVELYEDNIQTTLHARISKVNTETGQAITSFTIYSTYTGGAKAKSEAAVLIRAGRQVEMELRSMYRLVSEVLEVSPKSALLFLGEDLGLKKGTLFKITTPRSERVVRDKTVIIPGKPVAIVSSREITANANKSVILRRWDPIKPGYEAHEIPSSIFSWGIRGIYGSEASQLGLQFQGYWKSFSRFGGGMTFGLGTVKDSRDDTDFAINFGGDFYFRFINSPSFSVMGVTSIPITIANRSDDKNNAAYSMLFTPRVGGRIDILTSPQRDVFIQAEYVLGASQSPWSYSEGEGEDSKKFRAEWDGPAPEIKPSGLYISLGVRFISFSGLVEDLSF